jgi:hypothetical protein
MTTGQTLLAMGALVLLTTVMLNFYRIFHSSWDTIDSTQIGIDATSIATSLMEYAHGLAFDHVTADTAVTPGNEHLLTAPGSLNVESGTDPVEDRLEHFNDFDDFNFYNENNLLIIDAGQNGIYHARFDVYYVRPENVTEKVNERTFAKRMDMWIWRVEPPPPVAAGVDIVHMWTVMGYHAYY